MEDVLLFFFPISIHFIFWFTYSVGNRSISLILDVEEHQAWRKLKDWPFGAAAEVTGISSDLQGLVYIWLSQV